MMNDNEWFEIEGVASLVGPLDSSKFIITWKTIENGKVTSCLGPICKDCTCGYVKEKLQGENNG